MNIVRGKKRHFIILLVLLGLVPAAFPLTGLEREQNGVNDRVDLSSARREIEVFEAIINNLLNTAFTAPYALSQKTKGAYLPGYGVAFNFLINIHRALVNTPFGQTRTGVDISPEQKRKRIEDLKDRLTRLLLDQGDSLRQVKKDEFVTIVAFFEDRNFPDEESQNKTVVMSIFKKDLDELARREDRLKDFKQRMKIIEY